MKAVEAGEMQETGVAWAHLQWVAGVGSIPSPVDSVASGWSLPLLNFSSLIERAHAEASFVRMSARA